MSHKRYKSMTFEVECSCGQCEHPVTDIILVVEEGVTFQDLVEDRAEYLCECPSEHAAEHIVKALNRPMLN